MSNIFLAQKNITYHDSIELEMMLPPRDPISAAPLTTEEASDSQCWNDIQWVRDNGCIYGRAFGTVASCFMKLFCCYKESRNIYLIPPINNQNTDSDNEITSFELLVLNKDDII